MDIRIGKTNLIRSVKDSKGNKKYIIDLGTILYNNSFKSLNNLEIPIFSQTIFSLPEDVNKYAAVSVFYKISNGQFIFKTVRKSTRVITSANTKVVFNTLPICQFILKQRDVTFEVVSVNEYSQMATFSITDDMNQGEQGLKGPIGLTGGLGLTGSIGLTGALGDLGYTGAQGDTGIGATGRQGLQGDTGWYPPLDLLLYLKFKSSDQVQTDYSVYERDFQWNSTNGSFFSHETGIIDNAHFPQYQGGSSKYLRNEYIDVGMSGLGTTGSISFWFRLDALPIPDFKYSIDEDIPTRVRFEDISKNAPTNWVWEFGDNFGSISRGIPETSFDYGVSGTTFEVTLTVTNAIGSNSITKTVVIP